MPATVLQDEGVCVCGNEALSFGSSGDHSKGVFGLVPYVIDINLLIIKTGGSGGSLMNCQTGQPLLLCLVQ